MVALYIGGQKVEWADAEKLFAAVAAKQTVEFCDATGRVIATSVPVDEPLIPWEPGITHEEIERMAEPGRTFDEVKKRLGWE